MRFSVISPLNPEPGNSWASQVADDTQITHNINVVMLLAQRSLTVCQPTHYSVNMKIFDTIQIFTQLFPHYFFLSFCIILTVSCNFLFLFLLVFFKLLSIPPLKPFVILFNDLTNLILDARDISNGKKSDQSDIKQRENLKSIQRASAAQVTNVIII